MPFHYWTPDAYQGSPTPVTGYLSVGPKVAAFALILRLFVDALGPAARPTGAVHRRARGADHDRSATSSALGQDNIKRMLAYSSIAHTGYILVGLGGVRGGAGRQPDRASRAAGRAVLQRRVRVHEPGRLRVVAALQRRPGVTSQITTFAGLGRRAPLLGVLMTLFLLSLTGIPPTGRVLGQGVVILGRGAGRRRG